MYFNKSNDYSLPLPVKRLSLSSTNTPRLCFANWNNLEYLDMSLNNINTFEVSKLNIVYLFKIIIILIIIINIIIIK